MNDIINTILKSDTFLITAHISPDGDAVGSSIALGKALKKIDKQVTYYLEEPLPDKLCLFEELKLPSEKLLQYDVGFFLDCSDVGHLYDKSLIYKCKTKVVIDHHSSNIKYGDFNYVDINASATGEIIYELIKLLKIPIDAEIAAGIYTALVTDTGNFKYSNVTSRTHEIASDMYKYNNDLWKLNRKLFDEHPIGKVRLMGKAINNLEFYHNNKIAMIIMTFEDFYNKDLEEIDNSYSEGIINIARDIIGVEIAVLLREYEIDKYKVSFRSNSDINVGEIAVHFGGGGHNKASGCIINGKLKYVKEQILDSIIET